MGTSPLLRFCVVAFCLVVGSQRAGATAFTLNSYSIDARSVDPGLVVTVDPLLPQPFDFVLTNAGDSLTVPLFLLGSDEVWTNADDWVQYPIKVTFDFTAPPPPFGDLVTGVTGAAWFLLSFGYAKWDGPVLMPFGSAGVLGVSLADVAFLLPCATPVDVTFTLVAEDVPEPTSLLLLGTGLIGLVARTRRRR